MLTRADCRGAGCLCCPGLDERGHRCGGDSGKALRGLDVGTRFAHLGRAWAWSGEMLVKRTARQPLFQAGIVAEDGYGGESKRYSEMEHARVGANVRRTSG